MSTEINFQDIVVLFVLFSVLNVSVIGLIVEGLWIPEITNIDSKEFQPEAMEWMIENGTKHNITGLNIPHIGYIVYTYGRNFEAINQTHYHEACHELIRHDYYHFCKEYYEDE